MKIESELREALDEGTARSLSVVFFLNATPLSSGAGPLMERRLEKALAAREMMVGFIEAAQKETGEIPALTNIFGAMDSFLVEASPEFIQTLIDRGERFVNSVQFNSAP